MKAELSLISTKDTDKMLKGIAALYEQITGKTMTEAEIAEARRAVPETMGPAKPNPQSR